MNQPRERALEAAVVSRLTRRLLPFLFVLYVVAYLDRINVGFAALEMQKQLGFSDKVYGLGAGMFFAGYFFLQLPSNLALTRVGARRWIAGIIVVWGLISASTVFVTTAQSFYTLRFLLGTAEAGFFPGMILHLRNWFPAQARARAVALFVMGAPVSGVIGGPISGALLGLHGAGLAGWQWLFLLEGAPAVILGTVVLYGLADRPAEAPWLTAEEKTWLAETLRREHSPEPAGRDGVLAAFANPAVWGLTLVYFTVAACWYGLTLWLPKMIKSVSGTSNLATGVISAVPYLAAAVAMSYWGMRSDRSGERRWHLAGAAFAGAAALCLAAYVTSAVATIAALSLAMLAVDSTFGPFWAASTSVLKGATAAAGIALINSVGNLGGFCAPYMMGLMKAGTGGFRGGLLVLGAAAAIGGLVTLAVVPGRRDGARSPNQPQG
jgi:ACS family tartrate transporter-like MFS transporter